MAAIIGRGPLTHAHAARRRARLSNPTTASDATDASDVPIKKRALANRWTPKLADGGFTPIVDAFLDHYGELEITNPEAMFLIHLIRHKWDEDAPYPGFNGIATKMNITDTSTRNYARDLEARGYIKRIPRKGKTTMFDLTPLFYHLERLVDKKAADPKNKRRLLVSSDASADVDADAASTVE